MPQAPDNKEIYDSNWAEWENIKRHGPMSRHTQRIVLGLCRTLPFASVLDVGCGPGVFLDIMKRKFPAATVSGTDISSSAIELARRRLPGSDFFEVDMSKSPPDGKWDLVTMIDVAEHIENDVQAFANIRTVCNNYLLVVTLEGTMRAFEPEIGHVRNYKPGELPAKLEQAGFDVVRYMHWGWPLYSPLYRNMSSGIDAHHRQMTAFRRWLAQIAFLVLFLTWPGKGDLVVAVARPKERKTTNG